jgi:LysR family transcriptional regulator, carnitine catabolism transcriptional activator
MALNIKYRPLKAFLLAVTSGSFTNAAGLLGVTQPSFTVLIQDLEATLGMRLFERSTRSIRLTAAGEDFLTRIRRPVTDIEEAYKSVLDLAEVHRRSVLLGALPSTAFALVAPALETLRVAHPALFARVIEAHNDELLTMLRTNQVECALATLLEPAPDLAFQPLIEDCFCAIFPALHSLAERPRIVWTDLEPHDLILLSKGSSAREQFDRALQRRFAAPGLVPRYDVTHIITAASMVRRGLGVALLPRLSLPELNLKGLIARAIWSAGARRTIGVVYRRDRVLGPAMLRFIEHLHAAVPAVEAKLIPIDRVPPVARTAAPRGRRRGR